MGMGEGERNGVGKGREGRKGGMMVDPTKFWSKSTPLGLIDF